MFFNTKNSKSNAVAHYNKNKLLPISEAAFALLQWAEYGQLPEFQKQEEAMQQHQQQQQNHQNETETNDVANSTALKSLSNALNNFGDADHATNGTDREDSKPSATTLPEMDDPTGF